MTTIRQINSQEQMKTHLTAVHNSQPVVEILFGETAVGAARISFDGQRPDELVIRTTMPVVPQGGVLKLKYFLSGFVHFFECEVISVRSLGSAGAFIKIRRPETISAINRRRYLRHYPTFQQPINVTLELPQSGPVTYTVQDISASGFSMLVPFQSNFSEFRKELHCALDLPGHGSLSTQINLRNVGKRKEGFRIGVEMVGLSEVNRKKLVDFMVEQTIKSRQAIKNNQPAQPPTLCLIYDNEKNADDLRYLEQLYRLIRHYARNDWKRMAALSPDVLLFDLDSINPSALLSKLRVLANLEQAPVIVIADENRFSDISGDATILSQFRDPAALIEAVEQVLPQRARPLDVGSAAQHGSEETKPMKDAVLILDLKTDLIQEIVEAVENQHLSVLVKNDLKGVLDTVKSINPLLIAIRSDPDTALENLLRMFKLNKHTNTRPILLLTDDMKDVPLDSNIPHPGIRLLSIAAGAAEVARQIAIIALQKRPDAGARAAIRP